MKIKFAINFLMIFISAMVMAETEHIFTIEIPTCVGKVAEAVRPDGKRFHLGKVVKLPILTNYPAYTASAWIQDSAVAASAVNAVHLKITTEDKYGRIISLIPAKTVAPAVMKGSELIIDSEAGSGIFGGWAPTVGSNVKIRDKNGSFRNLTSDINFSKTDVLTIDVEEDLDAPYMFEFENKKNGLVKAFWQDKSEVIAIVRHPVSGVGRFDGGQFQRCGAIRANHCGVICISTSPYNEVGGFQIMPFEHSFSREMLFSWSAAQWMIIKSLDGKTTKASAPLFRGLLCPGARPLEKLWNNQATYGRKSVVMCRINNGEWQRLETMAGKQNHSLDNMTHLRIYAPLALRAFPLLAKPSSCQKNKRCILNNL